MWRDVRGNMPSPYRHDEITVERQRLAFAGSPPSPAPASRRRRAGRGHGEGRRRPCRAGHSYLAREYGVARYERVRGADFAQADAYHERTRAFRDRVRQDWQDAFAAHAAVTLKGQSDRKGSYKPLFERADESADKPATYDAAADARLIDAALAETGLTR